MFAFYDYFPTPATVKRMNSISSLNFHFPDGNTFIFLTMYLYEIDKIIEEEDCL